jgi:hypothetical protein
MKEAFKKLLEWLQGAIGGWLTGIVASIWTAGPIQSLFNYQVGWYFAYAYLFIIPLLMFLAFIFLLKRRWAVGLLLIAAVAAVFVWAHLTISTESPYRFVEFIALWTIVVQFAAIAILGAWFLFWDRYEFVRKSP